MQFSFRLESNKNYNIKIKINKLIKIFFFLKAILFLAL